MVTLVFKTQPYLHMAVNLLSAYVTCFCLLKGTELVHVGCMVSVLMCRHQWTDGNRDEILRRIKDKRERLEKKL